MLEQVLQAGLAPLPNLRRPGTLQSAYSEDARASKTPIVGSTAPLEVPAIRSPGRSSALLSLVTRVATAEPRLTPARPARP